MDEVMAMSKKSASTVSVDVGTVQSLEELFDKARETLTVLLDDEEARELLRANGVDGDVDVLIDNIAADDKMFDMPALQRIGKVLRQLEADCAKYGCPCTATEDDATELVEDKSADALDEAPVTTQPVDEAPTVNQVDAGAEAADWLLGIDQLAIEYTEDTVGIDPATLRTKAILALDWMLALPEIAPSVPMGVTGEVLVDNMLSDDAMLQGEALTPVRMLLAKYNTVLLVELYRERMLDITKAVFPEMFADNQLGVVYSQRNAGK